jgi:hypothetical protein
MTAPSPADPLGYDAFIGGPADDLAANGRSATGLELLDASLLHRLECETLPCVDAPDGVIPFGINVRLWIGEATDAASLDAKIPLVDGAFQLDPRVAQTSGISIAPAAPGTTVQVAGVDAAVAIVLSFTVTTITGATLSRIVGVTDLPTNAVAFLAQV